MKKALVILLLLLVAVAADAAVKKKRFDVGPVSDTATTAVEAPAVAPPETPKSNFLSVISAAQKTLREKLTAAISAMKSGEWGAIWKFLAICLIYGMLHALGPGHGKSIVVGYFIARRGRWRQGVALGAGITVTHTLSAILLLFIFSVHLNQGRNIGFCAQRHIRFRLSSTAFILHRHRMAGTPFRFGGTNLPDKWAIVQYEGSMRRYRLKL